MRIQIKTVCVRLLCIQIIKSISLTSTSENKSIAEQKITMCLKHQFKHIIINVIVSIVLCYLKYLVLIDKYKHTYIKCMLN